MELIKKITSTLSQFQSSHYDNCMKLYISAIALCLIATVASGQYSINTGIQTNRVVAAGAVSNYTSSITIARTRYLAARVSVATEDTGATGSFYTLWQTSLDNTNWNDAFVITNTISGTNIISAQTNHIDIGSHQYLRLARATNNATHQATNFYATVTYKVSVAQDVVSAIGYDVMPATANLTNWSSLSQDLFQRADPELTNWAAWSVDSFQRAQYMLTNVANTNGYLLPTSWTNVIDEPDFSANTNAMTTDGNSYAIDTLYTNVNQRTFLTGSSILNSGVTGDAAITLFYTNGASNAELQMQTGLGISMANKIPFGVMLAPSATFKFVSSFGSGASGYITNTINWKL